MARKLVWVYSRLRRRINFRPTRTSSTERTGPGFCAFKASADRPAQKNATSDIISSQPIVCPSDKSRSRSRVFTDQQGRKCVLQNSRLLWLQSLLCRPGLVVGSGVSWTVKLPVKHHTKNATSDVVSSQPIACPSEQSRSRSRVFSPTRKVGSAFFRTHVYCDSSPSLADPASLSVVGFVDEQNTAHLHVKYHKRTPQLTSSNQPIACLSDQQAGHVTHRTPSVSKNRSQGLSQQLSNLLIRRAIKEIP